MSAPTSAPISRSVSHRQQSSASRVNPHTASPHRSQSQSYRTPAASPSAQGGVAHVARRDFEQTNLPQQSSAAAHRSSASRDSNATSAHPVRADSLRNAHSRTSSRADHGRFASVDAAVSSQPPSARPDLEHPPSRATQAVAGRRRTSLTTSTGTWQLGKTVGAGSMGKVKLARNAETGEQAAIKIVPRQSTDEHRTQADKDRADHSKEIRTQREAAIVSLVNHPYICGMRDFVRTNYHWYMLFEYVNGGQMLDYIISHGRLKEKPARKFARQIASALDYCHRNSIVHRDLKIENILISKTGDIKIIDFGLSNLFSPSSFLKTFCGSLYFAAPELLQARQYTGPEVDLWSFGIVLYVLVCGKVPFDDQSMPQLHAKIKKGYVEYPPWLSQECKNLISRMLVTDPKQRATLAEIMNHPWMNKGFGGPPENFLPHREPLQLPLDQRVIQKMHGFDFGSPEAITQSLTKVIESEEYQRAVKSAARKNATHSHETDRKRGVFDFYKRRNSQSSREALTAASTEQVPLGHDPVNAFSPLISVYFLAREKLEREAQEANPGALTMPPVAPNEKPFNLPDLQAPAAAVTNTQTPEMPGEAPTGGRTRPRARTKGEDEVTDSLKKLNLQPYDGVAAPAPASAGSDHAARKENPASGLLRRFSTRRKPRESTGDQNPTPPAVSISGPSDETSTASPPPMKRGFSVRRTRDRTSPSSASLNAETSLKPQPELLGAANANTESTLPKRFMSLRRSMSTDRRRLGHRGVSDGAQPTPPATSGSDGSNMDQNARTALTEVKSATESSQAPARMSASRTKSLGHARRESIQARRARRAEATHANVPEETDAEMARVHSPNEDDTERENVSKPVYLKGLFSVSTTSSKPLPFIRQEIMRVLTLHGVTYSEIKGGFSCRHIPSINVNNESTLTSGPPPEKQHRRKISFGGFMTGSAEKERDDSGNNTAQNSRPQQHQEDTLLSPPHRTVSNNRHGRDPSVTATDDSSSSTDAVSRRRRSRNNVRNPGETTTHVREDAGPGSLALKFEILIVKVPLLSLHGIQFKKVDGNMMHYKNMAQEILKGLRL